MVRLVEVAGRPTPTLIGDGDEFIETGFEAVGEGPHLGHPFWSDQHADGEAVDVDRLKRALNRVVVLATRGQPSITG